MCGIKSKMAGIRPKSFLFLLVLLFSECSPLLAEEVPTNEPWQELKKLIQNSEEVLNSSEEKTSSLSEISKKENVILNSDELLAEKNKQILSNYKEITKDLGSISTELKNLSDKLKNQIRINNIFKTAFLGTSVVGIVVSIIGINHLISSPNH